MSQRGFWRTLFSTSREHWGETAVLTLYNVLGGMAPIWIGPLLFRWFSHPYTLATFAAHGELALYSAAIIAPALYVLGRDRGPVLLPAKDVLLLLSVACLGIAIAAYAPIAAVFLGLEKIRGFDPDYYSASTLILLAFSLSLFVLVTVLDNARTLPPVQKMVEEEYSDLATEFDQLGRRK